MPAATAIWDPESGIWSDGENSLDLNSEEGWTLLPDGTVLAVQCTSVPDAQKYVIAINQWVSAGNTGSEVPDHLPHGEYRLVVIANGVASHPVEIRVERDERRRRDRDEHDHDHDEEIVEFDHEEAKYKDKDAKEAKAKEKISRI